ncbi:putative endo-beta-1,4-glucanase D [Hypsizygus marmoreus]|uniref:AA9 family lytic polysaccharide monooxygenase n=1 Tax=Hypsizygus marmoreus TaxID=39966 RepID=A0A369JBB8_HYPMA|nr:putative endo-beta-1,4-glucanase D [Hypsizygus marmoreus]
MQLTILVTLAACVVTAVAHTTVWSVWVNGVDQGDGRNSYIRSPPNNNPVKDLKSSAMACNVNNRVVPKSVSVKAGDKLTFEWYHDFRNDEIIAASHSGPIQVWMAPASGTSWTKLFSESYSGGSWAVDRLIQSHGQHSVNIPNVSAGDYLLRAEIVALHEANVAYSANSARGAQLYMSCVQIKVTSSGTQTLPGGSTFPGAYTDSTPGIIWNLYAIGTNPSAYQAPGAAVWSGSAGGSIGPAGPPTTPTTPGGGSTPTSAPTSSPGGSVPLYGQCGGIGYTGPTECAQGTCKASNDYYSQCL